ncbi:hypothetical protein [Amycolatopsis saalfeldensis]|uniref:PPE family protein n=1 Tax=Amycolatopsis saalfeldensis TaxID=394193 RepID=A0A1H8Y7D6_9PSEU|nr:hypothetical protein [Amycolatopsis saalfeldensis]SEP47911.1 hypothetical protein SAMN04489732_111245 [Amycolatopsis saalfeldensis]
MGFGPTEAFVAYLKQMQAEGKIIPPGELVRRVKAGPGPASLGNAQSASAKQASAQMGIEADTLAAVGRLESAWSGQSGDTARGSLRPLADVAITASIALHDSQNALTDQAHAFASTRDSLHDVSDEAPSKSFLDIVTPWDTDNEDQINRRNAAIQQNNAAYQAFTGTSDDHARKMPIDYGQVPDSAEGAYALQPAPDQTHVESKDHRQKIVTPNHAGGPGQVVDQPGSTAVPPPAGHYANPEAQQPSFHVPATAHGDDGTGTSGYVPPVTGADDPWGFTAGSSNSPSFPAHSSTGDDLTDSLGTGGSARGASNGSSASPRGGGTGEPGKATGTGRLGGTAESGVRRGTSPGATGARGTNGIPLTSSAGKGDKEKDQEHKTPAYLQEADPNALFGYDGKATPPVIGK